MRIEYDEDEEFPGQGALFRANLERCLQGRKGQAILQELYHALLALPEKRLCAGMLACEGEVCAVGALLARRRTEAGEPRERVLAALEELSREVGESYEDDTAALAAKQGIPRPLAWRIVEVNDIEMLDATPERRYAYVIEWVEACLSGYCSAE